MPLQRPAADDLAADSASAHAPAPVPPDLPALTRRLAAGDEAAWRTFHAVYYDRLWRYLLVVTGGDEHAAAEALQGTLLRAVRHVRVFTDEATFWSWLTVLARSARADDRRRRQRYLAFLDRFTRQADPPVAEPPLHPGAREAASDSLAARLHTQLALLPDDDRELLAWKYDQRQPVRTIAARLDTTEKAVESRLGRLRRRLKDALLAPLKHEPPA